MSKKYSRRKFINTSSKGFLGLAAASSLITLNSGCKEDPNEKNFSKAIIIGTGFGGAVAALRLGVAGVNTVVLEKGMHWASSNGEKPFSKQFPADERSTWLRDDTVLPLPPHTAIDRYTGVLEMQEFGNMNVYTGAGVGGGSLVYGGMTVKPTKTHFEQVFPSDIDYDELDAMYYPRVKSMLNAQTIPLDLEETEYFDYSRVFKNLADTVGLTTRKIDIAYDWDIIRQERDGLIEKSALEGELIYGNNSGCKNSLDKNYLKQAQDTGFVRIEAQHKVTSILKNESTGRYEIDVDVINTRGETVESKKLFCEYLFMGAGSLGTTHLLMKAKAEGTLPMLNSFLGKNWGTNGNTMFMRENLGLFNGTGTIQANPPIRALEHFDNPITPILIENAPYPIGSIVPVDCFCHLHLALGLESTRGEFSFDTSTGQLRLDWPDSGNELIIQAARETVTKLDEADIIQESISNTLSPTGFTKNFTYHPLGGATLGQVTDMFGRVENYDGLYIVDSSLMPGTSAVANPSWTIAALAERCMDHIILNDF